MKKFVRHITVFVLAVLAIHTSYAQKKRYVEVNSIHALAVPENPDYRFEWKLTYGVTGSLQVPSITNVTHNIEWSEKTTYHATVSPILDSVGCYGEPVTLDIIVVDYLSLHTFDDAYFTDINQPVSGNVGDNDFDETGAAIYYNPTPVFQPSHGTIELYPDGSFTYTPDDGFTGTDQFVYEAYNDHAIPMYADATVEIIVRDRTTQADLNVTKEGPAKALFGERITYTLVVQNNGPSVAQNVILKDTLAFGLFSAEYTTGGEPQSWNKSIGLGNLNPGESVIVYLLTEISSYSPGWVYNEAITWSDTYDSFYSDNYSIWGTEVLPIYVDLPNQIDVPSCETTVLPGDKSNGNNPIASYLWIPGTGLNDSTIANPVFTPDDNTIGKSTPYVLRITDVKGNIAVDTTYIVVPDVPEAIITGDTLFKDLGENIIIYGNESTGQDLDYIWWSNDGKIESLLIRDSIEISRTGLYYLEVSDRSGCESKDSVVVLLESHPPVTTNDSIAILSGSSVVLPANGAGYLALAYSPDNQLAYIESLPDSNINVLNNDHDINQFSIEVTDVITPPSHSSFEWDSTGVFRITPNPGYQGLDSLQYRVCNNGYPVRCNTAWIIINVLRAPLNADVVIQKSGDEFSFWGDTINYDLTVYSNGPDSATYTVITDRLPAGLLGPEYSLDNGNTWSNWTGKYIFSDTLHPITDSDGGDIIRIKLRAFVAQSAERFLTNTAYINTEIIENKLSNDTALWVTKIKEPVIANAGDDLTVGSCWESIQLDGSQSSGENLTYRWSPSTYLDDPASPTPTFITGGTTTYTLTVTDDDNISSEDEVTVTVLPPPMADAGPDKYIRLNSTVLLDGTGSVPKNKLLYSWETIDGNIVSGQNDSRPTVDSIGQYKLTVTDASGCTDEDFVDVYQFYYEPFAIPDYYSTKWGTSTSGNVLDNDYEPNGIFNLYVSSTGDFQSSNGGSVHLDANGSMTYTPASGYIGVDYFTYEVCNDAYPPRCSTGYVQITVNNNVKRANLTITKTAINKEALIGDPDGVKFRLFIENKGPEEATNVVITDYLSSDLGNYNYTYDKNSYGTWTGDLPIGNMAAGETHEIIVRATALNTAPDTIYNAATVTSRIFDPEFGWEQINDRNVDTAKVIIKSDLLARAELVERWPSDKLHSDYTIGSCDTLSFLKDNSVSLLGFDYHHWRSSVPGLLNSPDDSITYFNHIVDDTTVVFELIVGVGDRTSSTNITVNFSPEVIADAGPDRKMNEGVPLVIDATGSQGAGASYKWYTGPTPYSNFENNDPLHPIIYEPGVYTLYVTDMHGCSEIDEVTVRVNELFVVNDFVVLLANDTITANVRTNDYDPNLDNIIYTGNVRGNGPTNGELLSNPSTWAGLKSASDQPDKIAEDGTFVYVPKKDFVGYDMFEYEVADDNDPPLKAWGKVYIRVISVDHQNSPPVANTDYFFVDKGDTLEANILANDYDFDGGKVTYTSLIQSPAKGTVSIEPDGALTYVPYPGSSGTDHLIYQICDNGKPSICDTASVTINIHKIPGENHHPVAVDDAYYAVEKTIHGNLLANDFDPEGDDIELIIAQESGPYFGAIQMDRDGSFTYTPDVGFEGTDQVVYEIIETRTSEQYSARATLYITSLDEKRYKTDVAVVKTAPVEILSGTTIQYEIKTTVNGPSLANDVVISDTLLNGMTNKRYSLDGGISWKTWGYENVIDQMLLYADTSILIQAKIPDRFEGELLNTAHISHDMEPADLGNNVSQVSTQVYQRVIANAGTDITLGSCVTEYELNGSESVGISNLIYEWYPSELLDNSNSSNPIFHTEPGTTRRFMLVVSSSFGSFSDIDTAYVNIEVADVPIARAGEDVWPENSDPIFLDGGMSTGVGSLKFEWWVYDSQGNVEVKANTDTLTVTRSGDYYLTITDQYGCKSTDLMHVTYPIDPYIAVDDTVFTFQQEPVDIYILRNDIIDDDDDYDFTSLVILNGPSHGTIDQSRFDTDSVLVYTPEPYYHGADTFLYIMNTEKSPDDEALVFITVEEQRPVMPEGFSPNGDGINDLLIIENIELYEQNSLIVFNRWGNIVYQKEVYSNDEPWDGVPNKGIRIGTGALPAGVYLYILDLGPDERIVNRIIKGNLYIASDNRR